MKKEDLIKELQKLPDGIEICVLDWKKNLGDDDGSGSSEGIYPSFGIGVYELEPDEAEFYKEQNGKDFISFAYLDFENEDYDDNGVLVV
jgi:hypothetical protein